MQQHRFFSSVARASASIFVKRFSLAILLVLTSYFSSSVAHATISALTVADMNTVSTVENVAATNFVVFGGLAGTCPSQTGGSLTSTCSSCLRTGTGDAALKTCNDRRINASLRVTFTFISTVDGYPSIVPETTTGTGTGLTIVTSSGFTTKGNTASVTVTWGSICAAIPVGTTGATAGASCDLTAATTGVATQKFYAGVGTTSGTLATSDDKTEFTITIAAGDISAGTGPSLVSDANGITYFELSSGDSLAEIRSNIRRSTGFPTGPGINYHWVRALFEKRSSPNTPVWSNISAGSPHVDLEVKADATDATNLSLSPVRITSGTATDTAGVGSTVSIDNDQVYDFKLAVVDQAGNVAYYTGSGTALGQDQNCDGNLSMSPLSGVKECHTARPSEVAGVLANKLNCFVATAAYGSPMANEVNSFRRFRDTYLIPTKLGFKFVRTYYKYGPIAARFIAKSETLRALSRALLWAPLQFAKITMAYGLAYGLLAGLAALAASLAALIALTFFIKKITSQVRKPRGYRA